MINSVSSGSNYWYQQTGNSTLRQLIEAARLKEASLSEESQDEVPETSDSGSKTLSIEELMGMMQNCAASASMSAENEEASEESEISAIDADGDGTISADEYETLISRLDIQDALSAEEFFTQYDTNEDGEISSAELNAKDADGPRMPPPMGPPPEEAQGLPSGIDTDGDGSLSSDEYESMISQLGIEDALSAVDFFSRYDTNEDGEISADEIAAMKDSAVTNATAEQKNLSASMMRAYETNYQYMFDEESSYLNSIA